MTLFRNLRTKVLFYALLPITLVLAVMVVFGLGAFEGIPRQVAQQRDTELARVVAEEVALSVQRQIRMLGRLAEGLELSDSGRARLTMRADQSASDLECFDAGVALYGSEGTAFWSYPPQRPRQQARFPLPAELDLVRRTQKPSVTDVFRDPLTGEYSTMFIVPVLDDRGSFNGVLAGTATLSGSPLSSSYASLMEFKTGRSGYAYLVDGRGKFIYHRDRSLWGTALAVTQPMMRATHGLSGAVLTRDLTGERVIAGFAPVPGTRWALITRERWEVIVEPVRRRGLLLLAIMAAGGAASALLVFFTVGRILRPIRELTEGARRLAAGDFDHVIDASTGDEIEELARQFGSMAGSLRESYGSLEQKVQARTHELLQQQRKLAVLEERGRMARGLHDSVNQSLYSVTLLAEAARRRLTAGERASAARHLEHLDQAARQALKEMRLMVYELRPTELSEQGLIGALKQRLNTVEERAGVRASIEADEHVELPEVLEMELYGLAQEALNNALKHGQAQAVAIRLGRKGDVLELEVSDDGVGFDPNVVSSAGGLGLLTMRERTENLGGSLKVESRPGHGTRVRVQITVRGEDV